VRKWTSEVGHHPGQRTIEVKIIQAELVQSEVQLLFNLVWLMRIVPKLACNKKFLSFHHGWDDVFQCFANL
jgi:hypothetical protein